VTIGLGANLYSYAPERRVFVLPALNQQVDNFAFVIDRPPENIRVPAIRTSISSPSAVPGFGQLMTLEPIFSGSGRRRTCCGTWSRRSARPPPDGAAKPVAPATNRRGGLRDRPSTVFMTLPLKLAHRIVSSHVLHGKEQ
jgi:hypothetical protein